MVATKLAKYQEMRDFSQTGEPSGKDAKVVPSKALRFVIQKHAASHLHFDLRLKRRDLPLLGGAEGTVVGP